MNTRRRELLGLFVAFAAAACVKPADRPSGTPAATPPEFEAWNREAQAILSDALDTLRTFDIFMAYRLTTPASSSRTPFDLDWDPPQSSAWNEATHVAQGLRGRADQLFQTVSGARIDASLWREQRALADAAHALLAVGDALALFRAQLDALPPGDAGSVSGALDRAWALWTDGAVRWGLGRAEAISCAG